MQEAKSQEAVPEKEPLVRVSRVRGDCAFCDAKDVVTILAYDSKVYEGAACPTCVLDGKAAPQYPTEHPAMRPIVFVARGVLGIQPYAKLLEARDAQMSDPERTRAVVEKLKATRAKLALLEARNVEERKRVQKERRRRKAARKRKRIQRLRQG